MKIIFDSEEQARKFVNILCPDDMGLVNHCDETDCRECYEMAGIELEVKKVE